MPKKAEAPTERPGFWRSEWRKFWAWYERNYKLNITVALGLFVLQLLHLVWLSLDVVAVRLFDTSFFPASGPLLAALVVVDYLEIPALFSVSLVYVNELRKQHSVKPVLYLVMLNSQWLHILWITDEFVLDVFGGELASWPVWLAWVAILIDYLELPVMWDTARRFGRIVNGNGTVAEALGKDAPPSDNGHRDVGRLPTEPLAASLEQVDQERSERSR